MNPWLEVEIDIASATSDNGWNYSFYGIPTDKELRLRFDNASYNGQPITLPDVFVIKASIQYGSGSGTGGAGTDTGSGTGGGTDSGTGGGTGTDDVNVTTPSGIALQSMYSGTGTETIPSGIGPEPIPVT